MYLRKHLGLLLALAVSHTTQALAQEQPVYLVLPAKEGHDLVRVERKKKTDTVPVGDNVLYGVAKGKLAVIGDIGDKSVLQIYNQAGKKVEFRLNLALTPIRFTSGPKEEIVFSPKADKLYFIGLETKDKEFAGFSLNELNLENQKIARHLLPKGIAAPCLTRVPGGVGVYDVIGARSLQTFSFATEKFTEVSTEPDEKRGGKGVAQKIFVPQAGLISVARDGTIERVLDEKLKKPVENFLPSQQGIVTRTMPAQQDGSNILVLGARPSEDDPIKKLMIFDLVQGKSIWNKRLPFGAETFSATSDTQTFFLIDEDRPALVQFDKAKDQFTRLLEIQAQPIAQNVAIILVPE